MSDVFDARFLERLLRMDLAALADPEACAEAGEDELAYVAYERAGMLRRLGAVPEDCERALAEPRVLAAGLRFLETVGLDERLDALIAATRPAADGDDGAEGDDELDDELARLESPEVIEEAETLLLHRDRLQAALGEVARRLAATRERRGALARVVARLARFDARMRANIEVFYGAIPLIRDLKRRFEWARLDPGAAWWWREIEESYAALGEARSAVEAVRAALDGDGRRCAEDIEDVDDKRAAFALGDDFPGRAAFAAHMLRCRACRDAVGELERLLRTRDAAARPRGATPLRLAAAATADAELEDVRARTFRPRARVPGTDAMVAIGLRERERLRFTFTTAGPGSERTRALDGALVRVEGFGAAPVADGAAEIALPTDRPLEEVAREALAARRTLERPDGTVIELP